MQFPTGFDPARCVLFLGSGFTSGATNKVRDEPPIGDGLRRLITSALGTPESTADLKEVAGYAHRKGVGLYKILNEQFTIIDLHSDQVEILKKDWRRIYTTNYDDAVEHYDKKFRIKPARKSFSISDARPTRVLPNSIIHLHGYIHECQEKNVLSQLVLDHRSYAEQAALDSPWWDQLRRDFGGAQWIFFVGYSFNDFAIARYLTKNKSLSEKTIFVVRPPVDEITLDRLSEYGSVFDIGASGFANECMLSRQEAKISEFHELKAFRLIDPYKDNKAVARPSPIEIEALLTRGKYSFTSHASTFTDIKYTIPRSDKVTEATGKIENAKTLLIHSKTANGKSVFANSLAFAATSKGMTCVAYKSHSSIPPQELSFLATVKDLLVFLPTYDDAVEIADDLRELTSAKFVVEISTGTEQVRRSEVQASLPKPIDRVDLNTLNKTDLAGFYKLIDRSGLPADEIFEVDSGDSELRDLLIKLVRSPHVKTRLKAALSEITADDAAMKVLAAVCILRSFGIHVGIDFVRAVTREDPLDVLVNNAIASVEFGSFTPDSISFSSSVFCEFFLSEFVGGAGIAAVITRLAFEAARRRDDDDFGSSQRSREARKALGSLMQYRNISSLFSNLPDRDSHIEDIFETLRDNVRINTEPLFWLQYSIYMQDKGRYGLARKHMTTAYIRAQSIKAFLTYQLDTNYLKLILQAPADEEDFPGDTEILFDLLDRVRAMITADDHRVHALKVLEDIRLFVRSHGSKLTEGEKQRLSIQCFGITEDLDRLPLAVKVEQATDVTKRRVQEALALLAKLPQVIRE